LAVDLDNALAVEAFVHLGHSRGAVNVLEQFPAPERLAARGPAGADANETVRPPVRQGRAGGRGPDAAAGRAPQGPPRVAAGREWLVGKGQPGLATADDVLHDVVGPLVADVVPRAAERWFFIRCADPDWHLRLRFHGAPAALRGDVEPALLGALD